MIQRMSQETEVKPSKWIGIAFSILILAACMYCATQVTGEAPNWNSLLSLPVIVISFLLARFLEHTQAMDTGGFILLVIMLAGLTMSLISSLVEHNKTLQQSLAILGSGLAGIGIGGILERRRLAAKQVDQPQIPGKQAAARRPGNGHGKPNNRKSAHAKR